jgi:hypothetical protein
MNILLAALLYSPGSGKAIFETKQLAYLFRNRQGYLAR